MDQMAGSTKPRATARSLSKALIEASTREDEARVRGLLAAGADPNARGPYGETPLHWCAWLNSTETARALLAAGADPNAQKMDGETPLHWAAASGSEEAGAILLSAGADPRRTDAAGRLPEDNADGAFKAYLSAFRTALSENEEIRAFCSPWAKDSSPADAPSSAPPDGAPARFQGP